MSGASNKVLLAIHSFLRKCINILVYGRVSRIHVFLKIFILQLFKNVNASPNSHRLPLSEKSFMRLQCLFVLTGLFVGRCKASLHHNSVLCRSCGREVADPFYLKTKTLSPEFIERRNRTNLFGVKHPVSIERLKNPAGHEFEVVSFERAGGKRCVSIMPYRL